jgi:eukaryotic-like serine/threonine-protein kinase
MDITAPMILPSDLTITAVAELPAEVVKGLPSEDGEFVVTRRLLRSPSRVVDESTAALLEEFRQPTTIVDAIVRFSRSQGIDPDEVLDEAYPVVRALLRTRLLVPEGSQEPATASFAEGDRVGAYLIEGRIRVAEDTEIYRAATRRQELVALKILRPMFAQAGNRTLEHEARILERLGGAAPTPRLVELGQEGGRAFLALEWVHGVPISAARRPALSGDHPGHRAMAETCASMVEAFATVERAGVLHGDVHPENVLVLEDGEIRLIDFGLAQQIDGGPSMRAARGGVGFFLEPEYARSGLAGEFASPLTSAGQQYSLGALCYLLLTGHHYLDFLFDHDQMLRQIAEDDPVPFSARGLPDWPILESSLRQALAKDPAKRHDSLTVFASSLRDAASHPPGRIMRSSSVTQDTRAWLGSVIDRLKGDAADHLWRALDPPTASVNLGAAGIAYALYRMSCLRGEPELLSWADVWASWANGASGERAFYNAELEITPDVVGRTSPYHTKSGVHVVQALIAQAMGDDASLSGAIRNFLQASSGTAAGVDLTLGRSGTLLACSLLLGATGPAESAETRLLTRAGDSVLDEIIGAGDGQIPFSGIAHGRAGIAYATMMWAVATGKPVPPTVATTLERLSDEAKPFGRGVRWKRRTDQSDPDYWPGWCNGSAGMVFLWTLAAGQLGDDSFTDLAQRAGWNSYEDPSEWADLCCGLAGRSYALLNLYKHTGEGVWLARAEELAARAVMGAEHALLRRDSLYKGVIGLALLASDLESPGQASMPLFGADA